MSSKLIKQIMSSRLCSACSIVHPKPWGSQCTAQRNKRTVTNMEGATGGKPEMNPAVNSNNAPPTTPVDAYNSLLACIKDISSKMSGYDKRLSELSQRFESNMPFTGGAIIVNPASQHANSQSMEPTFTQAITAKPKAGHGWHPT